MRYRHRFQVRAAPAIVADFHRRASSLVAITPPPIVVRLGRAPRTLAAGGELEFTLWVGPLPVRWLARIDAASPGGFVDRQLAGPFARWTHRHTFLPAGPDATEVVDEVEAALRPPLLWGAVGLGMWLGLPATFAYRAWKTRRLLELSGVRGPRCRAAGQMEKR